ncbi:MAG: hypothetical protein ACTSUE_21090 [Promethearchaeota archaeon]
MAVNYIYLGHSYPLSLYPALCCFFLAYHLVKGKLPSRKPIAIFIILFMSYIATLITAFSTVHGIGTFNFFLLFEPAYFFLVPSIFSAIKTHVDRKKFTPTMFFIIGTTMVILVFISMVPGNPLVEGIITGYDRAGNLLDATVPIEKILDLYFFYHIPVYLGSIGFALMIFGASILFLNVSYSNLKFLNVIFAILLSIYIIGVPLLWNTLQEDNEMSGTHEITSEETNGRISE